LLVRNKSMKPITLSIATIFLFFPVAINAENLTQVNQLLSTKECDKCDLSGTGLVMANLAGAKLNGANLSQANLSQANLKGANLTNADLTGASLYGANLTGANLDGAKLEGTDLRTAYLNNASLKDLSLDKAHIEGANGIISYQGTPEQFYRWGMSEAQKGHYQTATDYHSRAIELDPKLAPSYLARGLAFYNLGREKEALRDAQAAAKLFQMQKNTAGYHNSLNFIKGVELSHNREKLPGTSPLERFFSGAGSFLLQLLL
jgi:tetratricopeptide (TPR) repeat protein